MPDTNVSQVHQQQKQAPCRTCTDFKTWAKTQRGSLKTEAKESTTKYLTQEEKQANCPIDKEELGRSTWKLLHTIAAHYPDKPTQEETHDMKTFFSILSKIYPCDFCAHDLRKELKLEPPDLSSQENIAQWLCRLHNRVNVKLGKPKFDCSLVNERWKLGWKDGSCD